MNKDGSLIRPKESFKNQEKILTSVVKDLRGRGGLPISVVEQEWFRLFMKQVEPRFQAVSRIAVSLKLDTLYEEEKRGLLSDIARSNVGKPSVTLDFWLVVIQEALWIALYVTFTGKNLKVTCFFC